MGATTGVKTTPATAPAVVQIVRRRLAEWDKFIELSGLLLVDGRQCGTVTHDQTLDGKRELTRKGDG
jgi:hypothetical protein